MNNMIFYKAYLVFQGTIIASIIWFFSPIYNFLVLNFFPDGFSEFMIGIRELVGAVVALLIAIKLILQIKKLNKEK